MLRSERLSVVLTLEQRKEKEALERMAEAQRSVEEQQAQIRQLQQYQQEYNQQIRSSQQGVVPVARLQGWQAFIAQLDQLIRQQEHQLTIAGQQLAERRRIWQQAWERRRGMEKYIETCRQQEQREQDLREQKAEDEAAGRAFSRRQRQ
ncbi:MAG: flagellar export protein FliJ [Pseudomonadota bacterium]|nr:flagellar export protein FliJ [Pseudomonadota bacterium]